MSSSPVLCAPASEVDEAWQRDPVANLHRFTPDLIRNFSVIAHIDHGKSTLADRLLELTGTIARDKDKPRILDKLKVEKERGITVKAQTASMFYNRDGKTYLLNLIDTPGHVDFSYEVSRSLSACQGTLLLVDASQGVQAQTVANFFLAFSEGLEVVPVLNKVRNSVLKDWKGIVDLPGSDPQRVLHQIATTFELDTSPENVLQISAKTGLGVPSVLAKIVDAIPSPTNLGSATEPFKALLFDTWYDTYVGVVCLVAVHSGTLHRGDRIASSHTDQSYEVTQLGIMHPEQTPTKTLTAGQVGFLHLGMKTTRDALIGDTFYAAAAPPPKPFPGFKPAKSMVFAGAYPIDASEFPKLQDAVDRLTLNDASVSVARETSGALGQGFRLGFLGTLHMDVFRERLEEEHGASVINTAPTVSYQVEFVDERKVGPLEVVTGGRRVRMVKNPAEFPEPDELGNVKEFYEPMVIGTLICPLEYVGGLMELCGSHRGEQLEYTVIDETRVLIKYKLPMSEILIDFYDQLKSRTQGYASFDYEECGYEPADLVKVNLLLNGKAVDALATIVHRSAAAGVAKEWVKRLKGVMDRQLVEIVIQASVGGKIVSRETVSALRKDVTAKLYGGDVTRKMKLLEKQKAGKKRMKAVAGIQLPQEAFLSLIKDDGSGSNKRK
ncbi:P-loop containing nucleoside triphosphate hydrolase protein [Chytriomyces sp. MP71]|nr:P-loop containing nucleoside triphosphate hydrolase protein [Chytriomyces sp. MP71]